MFDKIKTIPVDRKNSLPIADLQNRYRLTGKPVVFGDMTKRWPAKDEWTLDYLKEQIGHLHVPIYSNNAKINTAHPTRPLLHSRLDVFFEDLINKENDLRASRIVLSEARDLSADFSYPRLGFDFVEHLTALYIGSETAVEPMNQSSSVVHKVHCHFGQPCSVLLIPANQSKYVYPLGRSGKVLSSIDFTKPHFGKYPTLEKLSGYVAELHHGDALYIPAGFWYCTAYQGFGVTLSLQAIDGTLMEHVRAIANSLLHRLANPLPISDSKLKRLEIRTHRITNAKFSES